jgi:uncharacterized membrane protein YphA (DoxX/SURF4 family)
MRHSKLGNVLLWTIQALLAALFLFAGIMKFAIPAEQLAAQSQYPLSFIYFIGAAEILGALGLTLPGITRIQPQLTPFAAVGLLIIMTGATVVTLSTGPGVLVPLVAGLLAAVVAYGRAPLALSR